MIAIKRVLRWLIDHRSSLIFDPVPWNGKTPMQLWIDLFADADWAGKKDRKSTSGGAALLLGCLVDFWAKRQSAHALNTLESELAAQSDAARRGMALRNVTLWVLQQSNVDVSLNLRMHCDNDGARIVADGGPVRSVRHVELHVLYVRDLIAKGLVTMLRVDSAKNSGDLFTKVLDLAALTRLRSLLRLCD